MAENPLQVRSRLYPFRVLVLDDELSILLLLRAKLQMEGYEVWLAPSAEMALDLIDKQGTPHLALVDIHLAGMSGLEFCRIVRTFADFPIIMLTVVSEEKTVICSLEEYAEDYVRKPFLLSELMLRIRRTLHRIYVQSPLYLDVVTIDDRLSFNFPEMRAVVAGQPIGLTPTETQILIALLSANGGIVSVESLIQQVWSEGPVDESTLRVNIYRLRQKIEEDPANPQYLLTVRSVGYLFRSNTTQLVDLQR